MDKELIPMVKRQTPILDRMRGFMTGSSHADQPPAEEPEEAEDEDIITLATRQMGKGDIVRVLISYKKSSYEGRVLTTLENQGYSIAGTFKPYVNQIIYKLGKQMGVK